MSSKGVDPGEAKLGEVKLAPGWMSLGRKSRANAVPASSAVPSISSSALPSGRYSKAELLEVYEPGAPPGLPPNLSSHPGITSIEALVPVNIAPDEDLSELMSASSTSARNVPRGSPSRSAASLSRHRLPPASPPANGRGRIGSDSGDRNGLSDVSSHHSVGGLKHSGNSLASNIGLSSSAPLSSSGGHDSVTQSQVSSGGGSKRSGQISSNRDFWSGSGMLAPAERSSGTSSGERRPLALKPRSAHLSQPDSSANGPSGDNQTRSQHGSSSYWTRSTPRSGADSNSNWRGGYGNMSSNANSGGTGIDAHGPSGSNAYSTHPPSSTSSSTTNLPHSSRAGFGREGRETFSRNKEALKPTNTRDLSALAKGSNRDTGAGNPSHYGNRDREYRAPASSSVSDTKTQTKPSDIQSDTRSIWYYKDPKGDVQGPFSASKMMHWLNEGYYDDNLEVSRNPEKGFKALAIVFGLRKEEAAAPPGFISGSSKTPSSPNALNSSTARGDYRNTKKSVQNDVEDSKPEKNAESKKMTLKEMEEEVEKMRLENRRKNMQNYQGSARDPDETPRNFGDITGPESNALPDLARRGLFEGEIVTTPKARANEPASSFGVHENIERSRKASKAALDSTFGDASGSNQVAEKSNPGSNIESPFAESRFASLMSASKSKTELDALHMLGHSDIVNGSITTDPRSTTARSDVLGTHVNNSVQEVDSRPARSGLPASLDSLIPGLKVDPDSARGGHISVPTQPELIQNPKLPWGTGMKESERTGQSNNPLPAMPSAAITEHDLLALDPAIARASFAGSSVDSSSIAQTSSIPQHTWTENNSATEPIDPSIVLPRPTGSLQSVGLQNLGQIRPMNPTVGYGNQSVSPSISIANAQVLAHAQARKQAQAQAQVHARAQAQAQAQAAQAAQVQAAKVHAEAQARALAAQQAAHAQAQVQGRVQPQSAAPAQTGAQSHDPLWMYRHQLAQLQSGWDLHCRRQMDATRSLQRARQAASSSAPGSVEHQQALAFCSNCEAVIQEHTLNMERIKAAAQNMHAQMLRHQQQQLLQQQNKHWTQQQPSFSASLTSQEVSLAELRRPIPEQTSHVIATERPSDREVAQLASSVAEVKLNRRADDQSNGDIKPELTSPPIHDSEQAGVARNLSEEMHVVGSAKVSATASPNIVQKADKEESGWETVERKSRPVTDSSGLVHTEAVQEDRHAEHHVVTPVNGQEPTRGPIDSHVVVISAEKDPRKLEASVSEANQRERMQDEEEAMRRKAMSIPAPWVNAGQSGQQSGLSLREIQRQEELRSKAEMEQAQSLLNAQREQAAKMAAARQAAASATPWGSAASAKHRAFDLREQMRIEEEQKQRTAKQNVIGTSNTAPRATRAAAVVAAAQPQTRTAWASLVANMKSNQPRSATTVVGKRMEEEGTFWETVGASGKRSFGAAAVSSGSRQTIARATTARQVNTTARATRAAAANVSQASQSTKKQTPVEPINVQGRVSAEMAKWCSQQLREITGNESDDTTFAEYLASLKSGSEIRDTVLQNLGANDKTRAFADEFIRRLAFASESVEVGGGTGSGSGVGGGRKRGRRKGNRVDPNLVLGITSTSSSSRIMQGTIEKPTME